MSQKGLRSNGKLHGGGGGGATTSGLMSGSSSSSTNLASSIASNLASPINAMASAACAAAAAISSSLMTKTPQQSLLTSVNEMGMSSSASSLAPPATNVKIEKKHFERVYKLVDKIVRYCQSDRMSLINSPPYILDILPDINQTFVSIYSAYENKLHLLSDIEYFGVLMSNCMEKFEYVVDLFKTAGKRMYEETSAERQRLTKMTLIFSHMLADMKSIFPKGVYEGQTFRIAKKDAADFWKNNFGDRVIVSWPDFERKLNQVHEIKCDFESAQLRRTIQLTETKYVSIFEFDVFIRLFQPWCNLLNNWKCLAFIHPGYCAFITYDEVHKRLEKHINKPGSYLYRLSCTKLGQWAIGYVTNDRKILQTIPQSLVQALIEGQKHGIYLYPDGRDVNIDLSGTFMANSVSKITISKEQFEMYSDVGTSFQLCKICSENNKDRKIEPCGHLICSACLQNWQDLNQQDPSCPFCRCPIKTFEPIEISPFVSSQNAAKLNGKLPSSASIPSAIFSEIENLVSASGQLTTKDVQPAGSKAVSKQSRSSSNSSSNSSSHHLFHKSPLPSTSSRSHADHSASGARESSQENLSSDSSPSTTSSHLLHTASSEGCAGSHKNSRNSMLSSGHSSEGSADCFMSKLTSIDHHHLHLHLHQNGAVAGKADESSPPLPQRSKQQKTCPPIPPPPPVPMHLHGNQEASSGDNNNSRLAPDTAPGDANLKYNLEYLLMNGGGPSSSTDHHEAAADTTSTVLKSSGLSPPQIPLPLLPGSSPARSTLTPAIVTSSGAPNAFTLRVEDKYQFELLHKKLNCDKAKLACALVIANNDANLAEQLLSAASF